MKINYDKTLKAVFRIIGWFIAAVMMLIAGIFLALALAFSAVEWFECAAFMKKIALSFDQTANACLDGNPDMTISGRIGRRIEEGRASKAEEWLCRRLSVIDKRSPNHCIHAIERDEI